MLKQATFSPLEFASMIAAEEQCSNAVMPHHISSRIRSEIEQLVAPAAQRLALSRTVGDVGPENIASAVATTLFGSNSPDDAESAEGFFKPMASDPFSMPAASVDQYYDASNTFLDSVLQRRRGNGVSVSLIASEACSQLGLPMVGLASPAGLLLAPAEATDQPLVLDCYSGCGVMDEARAAKFLAAELGPGMAAGADEEKLLEYGRARLRALRATPLTALQWGASMLRSLRDVHEEEEDVVRLLGVCDRLRLLGAHSNLAVSEDEMREYAGQVALCIYQLRWKQRRNEARALLRQLARFSDETPGANIERVRVDELLSKPWFEEE